MTMSKVNTRALLEQYTVLEEEFDEHNEGFEFEEDDTSEARTKRVVRGNKVIRKKVCQPGYASRGGKCVKMGAGEKRNRRVAGKKTARGNRGKRQMITRKRNRSNRKRRASGIK